MRKNQTGMFSSDFPRFHGIEVCSAAGKIGGKLPWWNNGVNNTRSAQCPGEGWVQGRLVTWKWFNDGHKNIRSSECPEGCVQGRIMPRDEAGKFKV